MTQETALLTIDELTRIRVHAKALWDSGVLEPNEKEHVWKVFGRIDELVKARREQEDTAH